MTTTAYSIVIRTNRHFFLTMSHSYRRHDYQAIHYLYGGVRRTSADGQDPEVRFADRMAELLSARKKISAVLNGIPIAQIFRRHTVQIRVQLKGAKSRAFSQVTETRNPNIQRPFPGNLTQRSGLRGKHTSWNRRRGPTYTRTQGHQRIPQHLRGERMRM